MRIDRESFGDTFTILSLPDWECSTCKKGKLLFDKSNIKVIETVESKKGRDHDAWEYYWISEHFIGTVTCNNSKCNEVFAIGGQSGREEDYDGEFGPTYNTFYKLKYIYPSIEIFKTPTNTPAKIKDSLSIAFNIFWIDKSACANAIRSTVEVILNDKKVLKTQLTKKGKRNLSLHERIQLFAVKNIDVSNYLMAIKWIGNAGSHEDELSNADLLDGLDLLKYALEKLYDPFDKTIAKITKRINTKRKP